MKLKKYTLNDFAGGFAASSCEDAMESEFSPDSYNTEMTGGMLKTVRGSTKYTDVPIEAGGERFYPTGLMVYYSLGGKAYDKLFVVATSVGSKGFFRFANNEWVRYDEAISDGEMGCINYHYNNKNYLLVANAYDGIYKYSDIPVSFSYIDDTPPLCAMALHYERLWGIGDVEHPNTVFYSAFGNPELWDEDTSDAGKLTITTYDGDVFVGIANVFDDIVLYRKKSLFRISGSSPSSYQLVQIPSPAGAVGTKAYANNGRYSFFVGEDGIYSFDGLRATILENNRLRFLFENEVNKSKIEKAAATIFKNKLYVALPTGSSLYNNVIVEYDIQEKKFNIRHNVEVVDFAVFQDNLMFIDSRSVICILDSGTTYNGTAISAHYETPFCDFECKNVVKTLDSVTFTAKGSGKIKVKAESENGSSTIEVTMKSSSSFDIYNVPIHCCGRRFKFTFENVSGSSFELCRPEFILEFDDED